MLNNENRADGIVDGEVSEIIGLAATSNLCVCAYSIITRILDVHRSSFVDDSGRSGNFNQENHIGTLSWKACVYPLQTQT